MSLRLLTPLSPSLSFKLSPHLTRLLTPPLSSAENTGKLASCSLTHPTSPLFSNTGALGRSPHPSENVADTLRELAALFERVAQFDSIGGLVGYQAKSLELILEGSEQQQQQQQQEAELTGSIQGAQVRECTLWGCTHSVLQYKGSSRRLTGSIQGTQVRGGVWRRMREDLVGAVSWYKNGQISQRGGP